MVREWRHLKMAKRAGRAHDSKGIVGTGLGELAVNCPACPQPGRNLPSGWDTVPESDRYVSFRLGTSVRLTNCSWLYRLILAMDANFRLKNRLRSNSKADPGLGTGWAYFVPEEAYREHVLKYATQ